MRSTTQPNILLVHCHDLGRQLGCYGVPGVQTPRLDAFAAEGVRFTQHFASAPGCSPSRSALFTGRYPHCNGVMGLCHAGFAWDLHPGERHLAQYLSDAGYAAAAVGTIHETRSGPERCGYRSYHPESRAEPATTTAIGRLEEFAARPQQPFYLSLGFFEPHRLGGPSSQPPGEHGFDDPAYSPAKEGSAWVPAYLAGTPGTRRELEELNGAVAHVDAQFGRLMEAVDRLGLRENTLVIFTTDHGIAMPRAKCSLYDPGIEIALLMRLPSRPGWHGGKRVDALLPNLDILPTLLELANLPVPAQVQGRSFSGLLDGQSYTPRDAIFPETTYHDYYDPRRAIRTREHKLILNFSSAPAFMDPSQRWRPRADIAGERNRALMYTPDLELYDLRADPAEWNNLEADPACAELRRGLLERLHAHLRDTGDPILRGAVTSPQHERAADLLRAG